MAQTAWSKSVLSLGILQKDESSYFLDFMQQTLLNGSINTSIQYFETQEAACHAVVEGNVAIYVCPLTVAPTILPMGLVIAALSERKFAQNCLITEGGIVQKVLTLSDMNRAFMQYLQPDYVVEKADLTPDESLERLKSGAFDALVLSQLDVQSLDLQAKGIQVQPFSVREFTPAAGQGVLCFIAAEEDLPTRRLLKAAHHPSVSAVTNIERTVQKILKDHAIHAYCERDRMGNYHLWAAALVNGELRKTRLSQSTTFGMAEKVCEHLLSA